MASLPRGLVFGPYEGHIFKDIPIGAESGYAWRVSYHYVQSFALY